jgi:hypothetical protein
MARCKYTGQFGKLVIGEAAVAAEILLTEDAQDVYGKLVSGKHPAPLEDTLVAADPDVEKPARVVAPEVEEAAHDSLSVRKVREELKGDIAATTIDRLMRDEFMRPEGSRKSVLELLRSRESGRDEPRMEVLAALAQKLSEA